MAGEEDRDGRELEKEVGEEEPGPPVDVLDQVAVKRTVDDCIAKLLGLSGYPEDYMLGNVKLVLMAVACVVACYAQLGPHSFPENKEILTGCVGVYTVACAVLQLLASFVEQNYIVRTHDKEGMPGSALKVSTELPRGEHVMTVEVEFRDTSRQGKESFKRSVGNFFSPEGDLDELALQRDVQSLVLKMEGLYALGTKKTN